MDECTDHLLLGCAKAREMWDFFSLSPSAASPQLDGLLDSRFRSHEEATISTAVAWNIWKRRNVKIFYGIDEPLPVTARRCLEDVRLWAHRCSKAQTRDYLLYWCNNFDPP
jgi:hypothetical protein